jgi:hypothetical protein
VADYASTYTNRWYSNDLRNHAASLRAQPLLGEYKWETGGGNVVSQRFALNAPLGTGTGDVVSAATIAGQAADRGQSNVFEWLVPPGTIEGYIQIPYRDMAISRTSRDAIRRAVDFQMEMGRLQHAQNIVRYLLGPTGKAFGAATFTAATGLLTFVTSGTANVNDNPASMIFPGEMVVISLNDGSLTAHAQVGDPGFVVAQSIDANTINVSPTSGGTAGAPVGWVNGATYFVFKFGTFLPGQTTRMVVGLQDYITPTAAADTFLNVNRAQSAILSGVRLPAAVSNGKSMLSRAKRTAARMRKLTGMNAIGSMLAIFEAENEFELACEQLDSTVTRKVEKNGEYGYTGIEVNTAAGPVKFVSEPSQQAGFAFLLDMGQFKLHSPTGTIFEWVKDSSGSITRVTPAVNGGNTLECRPVSYLYHVCQEPYGSGRFLTT